MTKREQETISEAPAQKHEAYDTYESVESELLDVVPSHWNLGLIKRRFEIQVGKMLQTSQESPSDIELPYLKARHIRENGGIVTEDLPTMWFDPDDRTKYSLQSGDVLVAEGGDVGQSVVWEGSDKEILYQNAINRIRSRGHDSPRFLYYWITWLKNQGYIEILCTNATILHYTAETVADTPLLIPSPEEQQAIADFLDRRTARIDALVAKKKRLLLLLQEKRQALITEAVTTGFERKFSKEETDIPWLQKLPANWRTAPVRFSCQRVTSGPRDWAEYHSPTGDTFLRVTNLQTDHIEMDLEDIQHIDAPDNKEANRAKVQAGDVLVAITGATICSVGIVPDAIEKAYINQHTALIRPTDKIESRWLAYCLFSTVGQEQLRIPIRGGTKQGLGLGDIKEVQIPLPPMEQQRELVTKVDAIINHTDDLIGGIKQSIEIFQEKRQALITAAVTGQIDVTEVRDVIQDHSV